MDTTSHTAEEAWEHFLDGLLMLSFSHRIRRLFDILGINDIDDFVRLDKDDLMETWEYTREDEEGNEHVTPEKLATGEIKKLEDYLVWAHVHKATPDDWMKLTPQVFATWSRAQHYGSTENVVSKIAATLTPVSASSNIPYTPQATVPVTPATPSATTTTTTPNAQSTQSATSGTPTNASAIQQQALASLAGVPSGLLSPMH